MRIVPLIVELSGAPLDTENCRSPVSVPEKRSVEVCPSWVTVTGSVGNDVSTASTMVVSAPAILMFFTVNLLLALSGVLVLTSWEMGSSVSDVQESPTPTGSAGRGDAMVLTPFPIWSVSGEGGPATPPSRARRGMEAERDLGPARAAAGGRGEQAGESGDEREGTGSGHERSGHQ